MTSELLSAVESRVVGFYAGGPAAGYPTQRTRYLNLGYWGPGCDTLDDACERLVDMIADAVGMREGDRVVDAGFGFADQDMRWIETRKPEVIAGLNITAAQVDIARERARERNLEDRLDLRVGSATEMPFEAGTFDRVVALESAFHFDTREDFFREAYRVLNPGGGLAAADVILLGGRREERIRELPPHLAILGPVANLYDRQGYAQRLREAGFVDIEIRDISANVFEPLLGYLKEIVRESSKSSMSEDDLVRLFANYKAHTEYVIASARKPFDPVGAKLEDPSGI